MTTREGESARPGATWTTPPTAVAETDWHGLARVFAAISLAVYGVALLAGLLVFPFGLERGFFTVSNAELSALDGVVTVAGLALAWPVAYALLTPLAAATLVGVWRLAHGQAVLSMGAVAGWLVLGCLVGILAAPGSETPTTSTWALTGWAAITGAFLVYGTWPEARRLVRGALRLG